MANSVASSGRPHEECVYDVHGRAVGTVAEIFGDASGEDILPGVGTGRTIAD
jgi:hypothetical protein